MRESQFQATVIAIAEQFGWLVYFTRDSRGSAPGFPYLVLVRDRILFRELKTDKGKLSNAQSNWQKKLICGGADYDIWRPSDIKQIVHELQKHLK